MATQALVRADEQPKGLRGLLNDDRAKMQITPFLRGESYERVVQEVILAASQNPQLREATPQSLIASVARAVSWGGVIGEDVHLVPFRVNIGTKAEPEWETRVQPIRDYKFKAKLIQQAGAARQVFAVAVYKNERFRLIQGTEQRIEHEVILEQEKRGPMIGAYAVAVLRAGQHQIVSKTLAEIDKVRQSHSKQWKQGEVPEWYALKTVIHQLAKLLPSNPKLAALLAEDEEIEGMIDNGPVAIVPAREPELLPNGNTPLPPRGNGIQQLDAGYDETAAPAKDDKGRPVPETTVVESPKPATNTVPGQAADADPYTEELRDFETGRPLSSAGRWLVPAGEMRGQALGTIASEKLVALKHALAGMKKYSGTSEAIDEVLEERRQYREGD